MLDSRCAIRSCGSMDRGSQNRWTCRRPSTRPGHLVKCHLQNSQYITKKSAKLPGYPMLKSARLADGMARLTTEERQQIGLMGTACQQSSRGKYCRDRKSTRLNSSHR